MKIKFVALLAILGASVVIGNSYFLRVASPRQSIINKNVFLTDGQSIMLDSLLPTGYYATLIPGAKLEALDKKEVREMDTDSNSIQDLIVYVNSIGTFRNFGYWSERPKGEWSYDDSSPTVNFPTYSFTKASDKGYDWKKIDGFGRYYHSLFRNSVVRSLMIDQAIDIAVNLARQYPADFRLRLIAELDELEKFTEKLTPEFYEEDVNIWNNYWKGFIYRRYKNDGITVEEIKNTITKAKTKLNSVPSYSHAKSFLSIMINSHIGVGYSKSGFRLYSLSTYKEIVYPEGTRVEYVKFFKKKGKSCYEISGTTKSTNFTEVYDTDLNKVK